jgi:two-component system, OmpR family, sensor histidine kinase SenX3
MPGTQLSAPTRPKWFHITVGLGLIAVAVALTVGWQILGVDSSERVLREAHALRFGIYFFGTLLFLLLIGGLGLLVILLLREVQLNERQSNFISAVTHELKTPVASLRLYLDTLELRELPDARRREFYGTMRQDLERLNSTISSILDAAMYQDRRVLDPQPCDLARLARRAVELTLVRNQLPGEAVRYDGPESLMLRGDPAALDTAVLNLLDNAVKYSREKVDVEVELRVDAGGRARLRVRDQGIGMNRAQLAFIFNRFYRIGAEVRRSRTGTGLGLFIVRSVVRAHRGAVSAESPGPERGSTFTITLPGVEAQPAQLEAARA